MFDFIARMLLYSVAVLITAYILPGIQVDSFLTAIFVAIVLAFLNAFVKPLLVILTIPVTVFTLGLFLMVINAFLIIIAGSLITGFTVDGFWWALLFSLILSFFTTLFRANTRSEFF